MATIREMRRKKKPLSITALKKEHKQLKKAMEVIRFLAFKHEVQTWLDANGTNDEKLNSILKLAREANWAYDGNNRTKEIEKKHK